MQLDYFGSKFRNQLLEKKLRNTLTIEQNLGGKQRRFLLIFK